MKDNKLNSINRKMWDYKYRNIIGSVTLSTEPLTRSGDLGEKMCRNAVPK